MRCYNCNAEGLECHSNWPATKILLNPQTGAPHNCDPRNIIITKGKWAGWSRGESARITLNQERIHSAYLQRLREKHKSPYEKETDVL